MAEPAMPRGEQPRRTDKRAYWHLLAAQVLALLSTGIATVALALLSHDLAGGDAGAVFGTALSIKMAAYVVIAPVAAAFSSRLPRRAVLVAMDLVRAVAAIAMLFVTRISEIFVLIFVFQTASAVFMPTFQAAIPEVLPEEEDYLAALARARLAYELEGVASPIIAAGLLLVLPWPYLFLGTACGFVVSALLLLRISLPTPTLSAGRAVWERLTFGLRAFATVPRLRALAALNVAVGVGTAMVVVNTVVLVQTRLGLNNRATAIGFAVFGAGSVAGALILPWILSAMKDRAAMLGGGALVAAALLVGTLVPGLKTLLPLWFAIGLGCAVAQTPYGALIRRSGVPEDKPSLYAAQFALAHAALLLAYPLAGWLGAGAGMVATFAVLGAIAAIACLLAARTWPSEDQSAFKRGERDPRAQMLRGRDTP